MEQREVFTPGQELEITKGPHAGEKVWFWQYSRRDRQNPRAWAFVQLKQPNLKGRQHRTDELRPV